MEFGASKNHKRNELVQNRIKMALNWLDSRTTEELLNEPLGKKVISEGVELRFQSYDSRPYDDSMNYETHKDHIDIHYMIKGREYCRFANVGDATAKSAYDPKEDIQYFNHPQQHGRILLTDRHYAIFDPSDLHAAHGEIDGKPEHNRKLCVKISLY